MVPRSGATRSRKKLSLGNSLNFCALVVGVFLMIVVPPLTIKIIGLGLVCWGCIFLLRDSYWTYHWSRTKKAVAGVFLIGIALCSSVPQFVSQWRIEHPPKRPCTVSVILTSEIVARVHLRTMWLPPNSEGKYNPIFQDLFHDWVIKLNRNGNASQVAISIQDARKPVDNIRVNPPQNSVVSEPKPEWLSGFEEPTQAPEFYLRTVKFATLNKETTITIRRAIKSRVGANMINAFDLDLDRQVRASAEECNVVVTPLSPMNDPLSAKNPHFDYLVDQLAALLHQKTSGSEIKTRFNPDEPYPPFAVNESEVIEEIRCTSTPCKTMRVDFVEHHRIY